MADWTRQQLDAIDRAGELRVAGRRADGTLRKLVIVWQVVVGDAVYVRSVRGPDGGWYRGAIAHGVGRVESGGVAADVRFTRDDGDEAAIDAAYRAKYGSGSAVVAITNQLSNSTTLRVDPL